MQMVSPVNPLQVALLHAGHLGTDAQQGSRAR